MRCTTCERTILSCQCPEGPTNPLLDHDSGPTFEEFSTVTRHEDDDEPVSMADRGMLPVQNAKFGQLASRLLDRFGAGDKPQLRRALFDRLQRECCRHGDVVYRIVASACRSAQSAREPDRYFCSVVSRRMREAGFLVDDDRFLV